MSTKCELFYIIQTFDKKQKERDKNTNMVMLNEDEIYNENSSFEDEVPVIMGIEEETEDEVLLEQFDSRRPRAATQHDAFSAEEGRGGSLDEARPRRGYLDSGYATDNDQEEGGFEPLTRGGIMSTNSPVPSSRRRHPPAPSRSSQSTVSQGSMDSRMSAKDYINAALEEVERPNNDSEIESEFDDDDQTAASSIASFTSTTSTSTSDDISLQDDDDSSESECEEEFLGNVSPNTPLCSSGSFQQNHAADPFDSSLRLEDMVVFSSFLGQPNEGRDKEEDSFVGLDHDSMPSLSSFNKDSAVDLFAEDEAGPNSSSTTMPSLRSFISNSQHDSLRSLLSEDSALLLQEGEEGKFSMQQANTRVVERHPSMPNLEKLQLEEDSFSTSDSENCCVMNKKD